MPHKSSDARVSIITTVYNGLLYLPETVSSVLNQSMTDFRYIIVDDGSQDGSVEYIRRISDPRVVKVFLPRSGRGTALNEGLKFCETEYVAILDADDVAAPHRLGLQCAVFDGNHEFAVAAGGFTVSGEGILRDGREVPGVREIIPKSFIRHNAVCHSSVMMRMSALQDVGLYNENRTELFDYDLWLRLAERGYRFCHIESPLVFKRIHKGQHFERKKRLKYLWSAAGCKYRAVKLFSNNPLDYVVVLLTFCYGLLPNAFRKKLMGRF